MQPSMMWRAALVTAAIKQLQRNTQGHSYIQRTAQHATPLEINRVHTNARAINYKNLQTPTMTNNRQVQIAIYNTPTRSLQHTHCCIALLEQNTQLGKYK